MCCHYEYDIYIWQTYTDRSVVTAASICLQYQEKVFNFKNPQNKKIISMFKYFKLKLPRMFKTKINILKLRMFKAASLNGSAHRESVSFMSRCVACD